jgi:hypothetical protein
MMDYHIGSIEKTEHGTLMAVCGGFPESEDDERGAFISLQQDLGDFTQLAMPYLYMDKGPHGCDGYTQDLTYSIEVKELVTGIPDWNFDKVEKGYVTKRVDHEIYVNVEAVVHESCSSERKVLRFSARYCIQEVEELVEMVHFLARKGFTSKGA